MKPSRLLPAVLLTVSTGALALDVVQPPFAPQVCKPGMAAAGDVDAIVLLTRALEFTERMTGSDHTDAGDTLTRLAQVYRRLQRETDAAALDAWLAANDGGHN